MKQTNKITSKIFSFALVLCIVFVTMPCTQALAEIHVNTFDGYSETNGLSGPDGIGDGFADSAFTVSSGFDDKYGTTAVISNKNTLKNGNPALNIVKPDLSDGRAIAIETAFKIEASGAETRIDMWGYDDSQGRYPLIFNSGGKITVANSKVNVGSYSLNEWYRIKMIFNPLQKLLQITIDGKEYDNYTVGSTNFGDGKIPGRICVPGVRGGNGVESTVHVGYLNWYYTDFDRADFNNQLTFEDWEKAQFSTKFNKSWRGWEVTSDRFRSSAIEETDESHGKSFRFNHPSGHYLQQFKMWPSYTSAGSFTKGKRVLEFSTMLCEGTVLRNLVGHNSVTVDGSSRSYFENIQITMDAENTLSDGSTYIPKSGEWYRVRWTFDMDSQQLITTMVNENDASDTMTNVMEFPYEITEATYLSIGIAENGEEFYNYLDDIRCYSVADFVSYSSFPATGEINFPAHKSPVVKFNMPLDASTVNSENVTMMCNDSEVECDIYVDSMGNGVVISPLSTLDYMAECSLHISENICDIYGSALGETIDIGFTTSPHYEISKPIFTSYSPDALQSIQSGSITAIVDIVCNSGTDEGFMMFYGLYRKDNNELVSCDTIFENISSGTLALTLEVPEDAENYYLAVSLLDSYENFRPYIEKAVLQ